MGLFVYGLICFEVVTADLFGFDRLTIHELPFSSASLRLRARVKYFYSLSDLLEA
jgi:hypothetical protein